MTLFNHLVRTIKDMEAQKIPLDLIEELMKLSSQLMCLILRDNDKFKELYDGQ